MEGRCANSRKLIEWVGEPLKKRCEPTGTLFSSTRRRILRTIGRPFFHSAVFNQYIGQRRAQNRGCFIATVISSLVMATIYDRNGSNPLLLPEIVGFIIDNVDMVPDLLSCACLNRVWSSAALKKLYKGSLSDMQFRTPDIGSLNCLFVASRQRFGRNMSFVKHLLLSPETPTVEDAPHPNPRLICIEKCRAMRHRQSAELLLRPQGGGLASLLVPYEIEGQDWSLISDLLVSETVEFLAIDYAYCRFLMGRCNSPREQVATSDKFSHLKALTIYKTDDDQGIDRLCRFLKVSDLEFFHLEEPHGSNSSGLSENAELLSCLRRQENLKA